MSSKKICNIIERELEIIRRRYEYEAVNSPVVRSAIAAYENAIAEIQDIDDRLAEVKRPAGETDKLINSPGFDAAEHDSEVRGRVERVQ